VDPEQELTQLRTRVAHLEALVERLAGDRTGVVRREPAPAATAGLDRRRMLRNGLGLSAAAVAGVGMLDAVGSSAAASDGDAVTIAQTKSPTAFDSAPTRITNPSTDHFSPVLFQVDNSTDDAISLPSDTRAAIFATLAGHDTDLKSEAAVLGMATFGIGVQGHSEGDTGVVGISPFGVGVAGNASFAAGVAGTSDSGPGATGTSTSGIGVHGSSGSNVGVLGESTDEAGVKGTSVNLIGVHGKSTNAWGVAGEANSYPGVIGRSNTGPGVYGESTNSEGVRGYAQHGTGVIGTSDDTVGVFGQGLLTGVQAESETGVALSATSLDGLGVSATCTNGTAVEAVTTGSPQAALRATNGGPGPAVVAASASGIGGSFRGLVAAVRLVPQRAAGHPTTGKHQRGELLVDSAGRPWLCTKGGTPGTWRQIAFV
jgi:hypothetical protein